MKKSKQPRIYIILGSSSDVSQMEGALLFLDTMEILYHYRILSAHRTPKELVKAVENANADVFICAAGKAAHLAGVVASLTLKPVLAVPMKTDMMGGLDSLLSTVQMPKGTPVACLGVGSHGAVNAAILATQILALQYPRLKKKLKKARKAKRHDVLEEDLELGEQYSTDYWADE